MNRKLILIAAGGTGGHIFPGLAVAEQLQKRDCNVQWLGTELGLESRLVPVRGIKLHMSSVSGLRGKGLLSWLFAPVKLLVSVSSALLLLRKLKPSLVIGMGGFVSGPACFAAYLLGIPLLIHEQNAIAGTTNKILARFASKVLTAFPNAIDGAEVVGNPLRSSLDNLRNTSDYQGEKLKLTVLGGSRGARSLNTLLPQAFVDAGVANQLDIWHQCGTGRLAETQIAYANAGIKASIVEFVDDMDELLDCTEVMVCRAGALTVSEVASVGLPALFIPFPYAIDDHQSINAKHLVDAGAALLVHESEFANGALVSALKEFISDREQLKSMATASGACAYHNVAEKVAGMCEELSA